MAKRNMVLVLALALGLPQLASATVFDQIEIDDPQMQFTPGSPGVLSSTPGDGTVLLPLGIAGNSAILNLTMVGSEAVGTIGTEFTGTITLDDGTATPLLEIAINSIVVTNLGSGPSGSAGTFLNLGGLSTSGQSELTLLGGSAAGTFGGPGTPGQLFITLSELTGQAFFIPLGSGPGFFPQSFSADANIQVLFHTPEPGTGLLLGASLAGIAALRRRRALR